MSEFVEVFKTCPFRLHKPSRRRCAMLKDAMTRAHRGFDKLLTQCRVDADHLLSLDAAIAATADGDKRKELRQHRRQASRLLARKMARIVKPLPLGNGPKASIQLDAQAAIESYVALKRDDEATDYPTTARLSQPDGDPYRQALDDLIETSAKEAEDEARHRLSRLDRFGIPRPLNIVKNRKSDGFLLLQDDKGRLFAFINLHSKHSRFARPVAVRELVDVRTGEVMTFKTVTGDLFPLAFSDDYQWRAFVREATSQSARLVMRDESTFDLLVSFKFAAPKVEPATILGVDRGIENLAAWVVTTPDGRPKASGIIDGRALRRYQRVHEARARERQRYGRFKSAPRWAGYSDQIVHAAANDIVEVAAAHRAKVVLEELSNIANSPRQRRPKGQRRSSGFKRLLSRAQYQKLLHMLDYKLAAKGLPAPALVRAAWTSLTCPACGHADKANRPDRDRFACIACGHRDDADLNAARNVALKHLWWRATRANVKKGQKLRDDQKFGAWLAVRARKGAA